MTIKNYNSLQDDIIYMQINSFSSFSSLLAHASYLFKTSHYYYYYYSENHFNVSSLFYFIAGSKWVYNEDHTDREALIHLG